MRVRVECERWMDGMRAADATVRDGWLGGRVGEWIAGRVWWRPTGSVEAVVVRSAEEEER